APTEGYGEAIAIPKILAEKFEIKTNLLQLVQANKFHGRENDNPHTHISNFKRMTATLKYRDVSNDAIKLMLFLYSLEDRARICEAWDRFKELLRACPHHGFSELTQIDTFYNGLTEQDQDSFNAASGAVEKTCVTCGGAHAYYECIATDSNPSSVCATTGSYNQLSPPNRASHQIPPPEFAPVQNNPNRFNQNQSQGNYFSQANNFRGNNFEKIKIPPIVLNEFSIAIKSMQNHINVLRGDFSKQEENLRRNLNDDMRNILSSFFQNQPSTSGTLPSNTIPNPKGEMKAVTTRSGLAYEGLSIPIESPLEKVDEQNIEEILDKEHSNSSGRMEVCHALADLGASINLMPISIWKKLSLPELTPTRMTLELADRSITRPKGVAEDVFVKVACGDFVQDVLDFQYNPKSSSPTLVSDDLISESDSSKVPIVKSSSPTLTPFRESDFFLEEIKDFLNDDSIPIEIENSVFDPEGDILLIEKLLNEDPCQIPLMDLKVAEESKEKSSIEEPLELELKKLPSHLEYAFLEDSNKLPVIIAKNLKVDERKALINVLKSHKRAIAWKISEIKGIDPRFCIHKILIEDDYKPAVQSQRRVNPKIHNVIKKEIIKLLDAGMIYPISDSLWVSPIHYVPKREV
nr:DNA-directed DNA polymerase [Tanacetum cinerariifolium]